MWWCQSKYTLQGMEEDPQCSCWTAWLPRGWSLRTTTGLAGSWVEYYDGGYAGVAGRWWWSRLLEYDWIGDCGFCFGSSLRFVRNYTLALNDDFLFVTSTTEFSLCGLDSWVTLLPPTPAYSPYERGTTVLYKLLKWTFMCYSFASVSF
jgi:hypothetical protein